MNNWKRVVWVFVFVMGVFPWLFSSLPAATMDEAMETAVVELSRKGLKSGGAYSLVVEMLDYDSRKKDRTAHLLQGALYSALQDRFSRSKLFLPGESVTGVSLKAVWIKGTYQRKGEKIVIRLRAVEKMGGKLLAKATSSYATQNRIDEELVAVLDIEAATLNKSQRKTYTNIFRAALQKKGKFNLISSDAIDRADVDKIQKEYDCSRKECATIIAQQLAAKRVVTTRYARVKKNLYYLTASLKDIATGKTMAEEKIKHDGNLDTLDTALDKLACNLAEKCRRANGTVEFVSGSTTSGVSGQSGFTRITPTQTGDKSSTVASLILESDPAGAKVLLNDAYGETALGETPYQNFSFKSGQSLRITLRKEKYHDKKMEFTLQGGMNDLGAITMNPAFGGISITSEPAGADVIVAGQKKGVTPYKENGFTSGSYLFSVRKEMYLPLENQRLIVKEGQWTTKRFDLKPNFGTLTVRSSPSGATARFVDTKGKTIVNGQTPETFQVVPGKYTLILEKAGHANLEFTVDVARGKQQTIGTKTATLRKLQGTLIVSSKPFQRGAKIFVNGKKKGKVPAQITLPAGKYKVEVRASNQSGKQKNHPCRWRYRSCYCEAEERLFGKRWHGLNPRR